MQSQSITLLRQELLGLIEYFHSNRFILRKEHEGQSQRIYIGDGHEAVERYLEEQPSKKFLVWLQDTHNTIESAFDFNHNVQVRVEEFKFHTPTITIMEEVAPSKIHDTAWELYPDGFNTVFEEDIKAKFWAKYAKECAAMLSDRKNYEPREIMGYTYNEFMLEELRHAVAEITDKDGKVFELGRVQPIEMQSAYLSAFICEQELEQAHKAQFHETPLD